MKESPLKFGGISAIFPTDWKNVTESLQDESAPYTFAKNENGKGALQFSLALYKQGLYPNVSVNDLEELLHDFATKKGLLEPFRLVLMDGKIKIVSADFQFDEDFLRVWYCSDGKNVVLVTYLCEITDWNSELQECERIVKSLAFSN